MSHHCSYEPVFKLFADLDAQAYQQLQELRLGDYPLRSDDLQGRLNVGEVLCLQLFPFQADLSEVRQLVVSNQGLDNGFGDGSLNLIVLVPINKLSNLILHYISGHQRSL